MHLNFTRFWFVFFIATSVALSQSSTEVGPRIIIRRVCPQNHCHVVVDDVYIYDGDEDLATRQLLITWYTPHGVPWKVHFKDNLTPCVGGVFDFGSEQNQIHDCEINFTDNHFPQIEYKYTATFDGTVSVDPKIIHSAAQLLGRRRHGQRRN